LHTWSVRQTLAVSQPRPKSLKSVKTDVRFAFTDVRSVKTDVRFAFTDVTSVKTDVRFAFTDVTSVEADARFAFTDVTSVEADVRFAFTDVQSVQADFKDFVAATEPLSPEVGFSLIGELAPDVHRSAGATPFDMAQQMTNFPLGTPMSIAALKAGYDSAMATAGWAFCSPPTRLQSATGSYSKGENLPTVNMTISSSHDGHASLVSLTIGSVHRFDAPGVPRGETRTVAGRCRGCNPPACFRRFRRPESPEPAPTRAFRCTPCTSAALGAACGSATPRNRWPDAALTVRTGRKRSAGAALTIRFGLELALQDRVDNGSCRIQSWTGKPKERSVMQGVNETANQVSAAVSAGGAPAPAAALTPGRYKVATAFLLRFKDDDLSAAIALILNAMTGNAAYPSPVPTLATLAASGSAFTAAVQANDGGTGAVARRDQARAGVVEVVRQLAPYVQHASEGDRVTLLTSGFPLQRLRGGGGAQPIAAPTGVKIRRGQASGQVVVRCTRVPTARVYEWRYAPAATPTAWTLTDTAAAASRVIEGLVPATQYVVQVRAHGRVGASDWSESVTEVAS